MVYSINILEHAFDMACLSFCFQGFVALIALPRRHLMAQRTTRQTQMMKLILIFPIHKLCWRDSCRDSWRDSENTSCQGPEHAHIDITKGVAHLTNNKDVFLCILRYHCRCGLLQQYEQLLEDMVGPGEARDLQLDRTRMAKALTGDRNFSISCEWGVCYPTLRAMINREDLHLRKSVRSQLNGYAYEILNICCVYTIHILTKIF
jgi:hypothetical protein